MSDVEFSDGGDEQGGSGMPIIRPFTIEEEHMTTGLKILRKFKLAKTERQANLIYICLSIVMLLASALIYSYFVLGVRFGPKPKIIITPEMEKTLPPQILEQIRKDQARQN
jgi:hypothetical protein